MSACAGRPAGPEQIQLALDQALRDAQSSLDALNASGALPWLRNAVAERERELAATSASSATAEVGIEAGTLATTTAFAAGGASAGPVGTRPEGMPVRIPAGGLSDVRQLLGQPGPVIEGLFGAPESRRSEGEGQAWLYRGRDCFLDVFLFRDRADLAPRVIHATARSPGFTRIPEGACVAGLLRPARGA
ncbi:MAG: hypothetical protein IT557_00055 [Alphaproteobacteria bacterium]|nr:hypothetical protein [Alphaproteobacteria bacterium]